MKFLLSLIKRHPYWVMCSVVVSLIATASELLGIGLLVPLVEVLRDAPQQGASITFQGPLFDSFLEFFQQFPIGMRMRWILLFFLGAIVVQFTSMYFSVILGMIVHNKAGIYLGNKAYEKLLSIKLGTLHDSKSGYFYSLLSNHCLVTASLVGKIVKSIPNLLISIVLLGLMCKLSWKMTLVSIVVLAFTSFVVNKFHALAKRIGQEFKLILESRNSLLLETIAGLKTIKQFVKEKLFYDKHVVEYSGLIRNRFRIVTLTELIRQLVRLITLTSLIALLILGTFVFDVSSTVWIEGLLIFVAILSRLIAPVTLLNDLRVNYACNKHIIANVESFLNDNQCCEEEEGSNRRDIVFKGGIKFDDVSFRYSPLDKYVLENASFTFNHGEVTAIVGSSGGGKSTIIDLLFKFYSPESGGIYIDGVNLKDLDIGAWRSMMGVVSQDTFLFNDTVAFNISAGNSDITEEQVVEASKLANAYDFIQKLPKGFETVLGDRGVKLSVGQRQRIAIARSLILNPPILVLDEATSNLDAESQNEIKKAMDVLMKDRTVITITHRLSLIKKAHKILVLEKGRIVESGDHDQLLRIEGGRYSKFIELSK